MIEVFYAHTISPVAIAFLVVIIMTLFIGKINIILGVIALIAYIFVGVIIPLIITKLGYQAGMKYRNNVGELSSTVLDSLRGLREVSQYSYGDDIKNQLKDQTLILNESLKETKDYEGLTNALLSSSIMIFSLIILFIGFNLYLSNQIGFDGLLIAFVSMISSFGIK